MTHTTQPPPHSVQPARLAALAALLDDWNGHGATPITHAALDVARDLAVIPRFNGGIQIEWHVNGQDVEISVSAQGRIDGVSMDDQIPGGGR